MKTFEKSLLIALVIGFVIRYWDFPGGTLLSVCIALMLAIFYAIFGLRVLSNPKSLSDKKLNSLKPSTYEKVFLIVASIVYLVTVLGLLFQALGFLLSLIRTLFDYRKQWVKKY